MTIKRALLIYGVVFLLALPLTFPVRLMGGFIPLPEGVSRSALSGSLWAVRLDWVQLGALRLGDVKVSPSLTGLFGGTPLAISLLEPAALSARVGLSEDGAVLRNLKAGVEFDALRELLDIPPLGVNTVIALSVEEAIVQDNTCASAQGTVLLDQFEGNIEGLSQLREISGSLSCEGGRFVLQVNPDNALRLSGKVVFTANGHYQGNLQAEPPPGPLFETFVDFLGQPRNGRRFQINFRS